MKFYSLWQVYAGTASVDMEAEDLADLLAQVEQKFGARVRERLQAGGVELNKRIADFSLVLLNGTNIKQLKEASLKDGDVLHIMPPVAGG